MTPELQSRIKPDRTWLASMPIFDPFEIGMRHGEAAPVSSQKMVAARQRGLTLRRPILGTLNVDAAWDYAAVGLRPEPSAPCGACRQVIAEFADPDSPIHVDGVGMCKAADLLPHPFRLEHSPSAPVISASGRSSAR